MKNREPFNIKKIIIIYNVLQVLANSYIFYYVRILRVPNLLGCKLSLLFVERLDLQSVQFNPSDILQPIERIDI